MLEPVTRSGLLPCYLAFELIQLGLNLGDSLELDMLILNDLLKQLAAFVEEVYKSIEFLTPADLFDGSWQYAAL